MRRPQKAQLSLEAIELTNIRPNDVKLKERMEQIDVDWSQLESSLDSCEQRLTSTQTLLLPCIQSASELVAWMDGFDQTVKAECSVQPQTADDIVQLHNKFQVLRISLHCGTEVVVKIHHVVQADDTLATFLLKVTFITKLVYIC